MKITLCGSARFEAGFKRWNELLTLDGHVVYSLSVYPSDKIGKDWYTEDQKKMLDAVHKLKIDNSDAIVVIDEDGYIGESTRSEIEHAKQNGKLVFYTSQMCSYSGCSTFDGAEARLNRRPPCALCYE